MELGTAEGTLWSGAIDTGKERETTGIEESGTTGETGKTLTTNAVIGNEWNCYG